MTEKRIESFEDLHATVLGDSNPTIYRDVRDTSFLLLPKIGRYKRFFTSDRAKEELTMLRLFKERAIPYLDFVPQSDWEWLAIAQHHGLPTRLLDWTRNPLVAAYFAVAPEHSGDSVIYAYHSKRYIKILKYPDPFARTTGGRFIPRHITPRITAQAGIFTIHPSPTVPLDDPSIDRLLIAHRFRRPLKKILFRYGIHAASLFPDLEGLAKHIEWMRTDAY